MRNTITPLVVVVGENAKKFDKILKVHLKSLRSWWPEPLCYAFDLKMSNTDTNSNCTTVTLASPAPKEELYRALIFICRPICPCRALSTRRLKFLYAYKVPVFLWMQGWHHHVFVFKLSIRAITLIRGKRILKMSCRGLQLSRVRSRLIYLSLYAVLSSALTNSSLYDRWV